MSTATAPALTRTHWASVDPLADTRGDAQHWGMFLYAKPQDGSSDRQQLARRRVTTTGRGWAALAEFDAELGARGFLRSSDWELGTGAGYVAWIEPMQPAAAATPAPPEPAPAPEPTTWLAEYATHLRASGLRPRSLKMRLEHAESIAALGELRTLTDSELEAWVHPADRQFAPEYIRSRRSSARRLFRWLHESGRIAANPAAALIAPRIPPKPARIIPDEVFEAALAATKSARDRAALLLGRQACLRLSEIAALRLEDRAGDRLRIDGKGGTVRYVWLSDETAAALDELETARTGGWYFPGRFEGHIHAEALSKIIRRATGWNAHSLRHAGATAAYRATRNLRGVQAMLGHASLATTQRYLTIGDDEMRALAVAARPSSEREDGGLA